MYMMHTQESSTAPSQESLTCISNLLNSLEQYEISPVSGFIPFEPPQPLPDTFNAWEQLAELLPLILKRGNIVAEINHLPLCDANELSTEGELRRAYILLSYIVHAYVHGGRQSVVPPTLSDPFRIVCDRLGLQLVGSVAAGSMFNYRQAHLHLEDSSENGETGVSSGDHPVLSGLRCITTFTGTMDEEAFNIVPLLVERTGGPLIPLLLQSLLAAYAKNFMAVSVSLSQCVSILQAMSAALSDLTLCNPDYFYTKIRPYLAGLDVDYLFFSGERLHVKLAGASAAQASLFPFLDHVLGVRHTSPLLGEMRKYMPGKHRSFLETVFTLPTLPDLILASGLGDGEHSVTDKIQACRGELISWRTKHLAIVSRYVIVPAAKLRQKRNGDVYESLEVAGTAGSSPLPFLKEIRNDVKSK